MIDALATGLTFLPLKFTRNALLHRIEAADPALNSRVGLSYRLTLLVPDFPFSGNFVELHTSEGREAPVEEQGGIQRYAGAEFRYNGGRNGKLDGLLSHTKPRRAQNVLSLSLTQTTAFCLRENVTGGLPAVNLEKILPKAQAVKAGLANEDFVAFGETFWNVWQAERRQFLTWQPDYKRVGRSQEEYLYFLLNISPAPEQVRLRVQHYAANGAASAAATVLSLDNPPLYAVAGCPVGAAVLGIPATATRYEVWLSDQNDRRLSETRTYVLDDGFQPQERSVLFVNSLGGWDTLRLTGQGQRTLSVSQNVAEVERPADAGVDFSELRVIHTEGEYQFQASTGYFEANATAYLRYLNELLLADELYLVTDKGHRPLQLLTSTLVDEYDDADLVARTFSFRILDTVENYSQLPAAAPVSLRATRWRGVSLRHILDGFGKRTGKLAFARLEQVYADDDSPVKPYTVKANVPGDPDYIAPITASADNTLPVPGNPGNTPLESGIVAGSTPYPSAAISRPGSYVRASCGAGHLGGRATIEIPGGRWGGENPGDADVLAEAEFRSLDTQAYADTYGTCTVNNTPVHLAIDHRIPMNTSLVTSSGKYGPVVALRVNNTEMVPNSIGLTPSVVRQSEGTLPPGTYDILVSVQYSTQPFHACKIVLVGKGREFTVSDSGFFLFDKIVVNSSDEPLILQVLNN